MPTPAMHVIDVEDRGDVTEVKFAIHKIMDAQVITAIGEQLFSLVDTQGKRKVTLNFDKVEYLASFILGKFITLQKKIKAAGGQLILCNIDPDVYETFEVSHLDKFFDIQKNAD